MSDPFAVLGLYEDFAAAEVAAAFSGAVKRGVPVASARSAMDLLRDPSTRAAAALLAPSMAPAAMAERDRPHAVDGAASETIDVLLHFLGHILTELDADLAASAVAPQAMHDLDEVLPSLPDGLAL